MAPATIPSGAGTGAAVMRVVEARREKRMVVNCILRVGFPVVGTEVVLFG